ncbi:MAG TPA: hypothetical protein PLX02_10770 [Syntrophorhabdaceae bacterium]|nr:hypothetical protein [Syntrophorhabdaceae bacterium]HQM82092.1 hypothetical protein [Syntrophorhabdaceae bacterium]
MKKNTMKRYYLSEAIDKWATAFIRIYERQGIADFEKYQYSIAKILRLGPNHEQEEKLLAYVKDITNPKDVLLEALAAIMLNNSINNNSRILAVNALRVLLPIIMPNTKHIRESIVRAMEGIINSPEKTVFYDTVKDTLKSINMAMQKDSQNRALLSNVTGSNFRNNAGNPR